MATTTTTQLDELRRRADELIEINHHIIDARFKLANEICETWDDLDYNTELWAIAKLLKESNEKLSEIIESTINSLTNQKAGI